MANEKTPAEALHSAGFERLKQQLATEQARELDASPGRAVGGLRLPVLREGEFRLPRDNMPSQPLAKQ